MRTPLLRLLALTPLSVLAGCATSSATSAEVEALRAQLRMMQQSHARLEQRLERLEVRDTVSRGRAPEEAPAPGSSPSAPESKASAPLSPPELAVVKLKPRSGPVPRLPTQVDVMEPEADDMEAFVSGSPDEGPAPSAAAPSEPSRAPESTPADAEYERAVSALRTGNVEGGVARLQRFAQDNPRHPRADNALYFSGLGLIGLEDYAGAARTLERLIQSYPAGDTVIDGMLRLAECRLRLNQAADARALYTRVVTQFPGTAAATQAEQRLAALPSQ